MYLQMNKTRTVDIHAHALVYSYLAQPVAQNG